MCHFTRLWRAAYITTTTEAGATKQRALRPSASVTQQSPSQETMARAALHQVIPINKGLDEKLDSAGCARRLGGTGRSWQEWRSGKLAPIARAPKPGDSPPPDLQRDRGALTATATSNGQNEQNVFESARRLGESAPIHEHVKGEPGPEAGTTSVTVRHSQAGHRFEKVFLRRP